MSRTFDEKHLPKTRLELRWEHLEHNDWKCHYNLVLQLNYYDCRAEGVNEDGEQDLGVHTEKVLSLGGTNSNRTSSPYSEERDDIDKPFRDGSHVQWDSANLNNLPMFVVCGRRAMSIAPNPESQSASKAKKGDD